LRGIERRDRKRSDPIEAGTVIVHVGEPDTMGFAEDATFAADGWGAMSVTTNDCVEPPPLQGASDAANTIVKIRFIAGSVLLE
jgi:hypothetical protein